MKNGIEFIQIDFENGENLSPKLQLIFFSYVNLVYKLIFIKQWGTAKYLVQWTNFMCHTLIAYIYHHMTYQNHVEQVKKKKMTHYAYISSKNLDIYNASPFRDKN